MNYLYQPTCQIPPDILDGIYTKAFGPAKRDGVFVEVGAHDGWHWSNTWGLAQIGWRGIYVEPVESLFNECRKTNADRPNIIILNCCIGRENGEATLGIGEYGASAHSKEKPFTVKQWTLDTLLFDFRIEPKFDLLVIDVEGAEADVLEGFSAARWLPKLVIIERPPVPNKLLDLGYLPVYSDWINTVYERPTD